MPQCCPPHASRSTPVAAPAVHDRSHVRSGRLRAALARIVTAGLWMIGGDRLERLLQSIPDSNDDFGIL